jgi:hypothetical protein
MTNTNQYHSLKTPDRAAGVALAADLTREIASSLAAASPVSPKPGGMNFGEPPPISSELIASILLVAISVANDGWSK